MKFEKLGLISWAAIGALAGLSACTGDSLVHDGGADVTTDNATDAVDTPSDTMDVAMTDATDTTPPSDVIDVMDVVDASDASDASDVTDVIDASDATDGGDAGCTFGHVIVGVSDYTSFGGYVVANLDGSNFHYVPAVGSASTIDQDHGLRSSSVRCETYDLWHSDPARIVTLSPADPSTALRTLNVPAVPTGADGGAVSANPYDIAVISPTKAYVAQYNSADVLVVNPATGSIDATISLAAFADADGLPEAASITIAGTHAFVALQQLDRNAFYAAPAHSHLAVIDTATDQLVDVDTNTTAVDAIELTHGNPTGNMPVSDDGLRLLVAEIGNYGDPVSGIDVIDTTTLAIGTTIESSALSGKPTSVAWVSATTGWASVDRAASHDIVSFEAVSGTIAITPVATSTMYSYGGLRRAPDGNVWAIGGDYNAGSIHAFTAAGTPVLTMPFATGMLNTTSLEFLP